MFERYTERARRVIFFGRYEASQFGSTTIETEHLLLGLLREDRNLANRFVGGHVSAEQIRQEAQVRIPMREKVATSIDLPLSNECKRILAYAAEEAERLRHRHIGTEHLFLGILREANCGAAQILNGHGLKLEAIREELARSIAEPEPGGGMLQGALRGTLGAFRSILGRNPVLPAAGVVPDAETARKIAEAVWQPLFGAETIAGQMPLQVELKHNVWVVSGSAAEDSALFAFILQMNGQILSVGRGKAQ
jgi:hypothetical protein